MTRETKANLIFLSLFVALSVPGGIILFKKKLTSTRMMYLPDPVNRTLTYMDPMPAPPSVPRVVPPLTAAWVAQLGGGRAVPMRAAAGGMPMPVMSRNQLFQVAACELAEDHWRLWLLVWDPRLRPEVERLTALADGGAPVAGRVESADAIPMPTPVRKELQDAGYPRPPDSVVRVVVRFDGKPAPGNKSTILLNYAGAKGTVGDTVTGWTCEDGSPHP